MKENSSKISSEILKIKKSIFFEGSMFIFSALFLALIILPLLSLSTLTSIKDFLLQLVSPNVLNAIVISLQTSLTATCIIFFLGIPVSYFLAMKEFKGKIIIETLLELPMVMPPLVSGLALLIILGKNGIIGTIAEYAGIKILFTKKAIIFAQFFVASPFFIKTVKEHMASIPKSLMTASIMLKASPAFTFFRVILPLCKNGIWTGLIMTWARAIGEFGATAMVAGCIPEKTETLTMSIYIQSMSGSLESASATAIFLMFLSFFILISLKIRARKKT